MYKKILGLLFISVCFYQSSFGQEVQTFFQIVNTTDLVKLSYDSENIDFETLDFSVNEPIHLLSYDQESSLLCAITHRSQMLLKIDLDGKIISREKINGLPKYYAESFVISAMDDEGNMFIGGINKKRWYKINVNSKKVERIHFRNRMPAIYDVAYDKRSNSLYGIAQSGELVRFDLQSKSVVKEKVKFAPGPYGSVWQDETNAIYGFNNKTSRIYKYDSLSGQVIEVCVAPYKSAYNDGTAVIGLKKTEDMNQQETIKASNLLVDEFVMIVYPNPSQGDFAIAFSSEIPENSLLKIHDLNGRIVFNENCPKDTKLHYLNLSNMLNPGAYVLTVESEDSLLGTQRIIID